MRRLLLIALLLLLPSCRSPSPSSSSGGGGGEVIRPPGVEEALTAYPLPTLPPLPPMPTMAVVPRPTPISAPSIPTEFGIQIHGCGYDPVEALDLVAEAGFTWVKQQVRWRDMEPQPGVVDWSCIDRVVEEANLRGLKVLLSVTTSPEWARPDVKEHGSPWNPTWLAQFCATLADRYRGRVQAVEVFNEPNLEREWGPYMSPVEYGAMLEWSYYAVKQAAPEVMVISAALAPTEWNAWDVAVPDRDFLSALVSVGGVEWMDCVGVHFNHGTESPLIPGGQWEQMVRDYREITGGLRPLCLTEFGYAVPRGGGLPEGFGWAVENTVDERARWLADMWAWTAAHPGVVRLVIVWNLNYWSEDPGDVNALYAIWSPGGVGPAYDALRAANMEHGGR